MKLRHGFTIVELLIVIVVIAILAAITVVAYNGIQVRASKSAAQADVANALKKLELFKVEKDSYPTSISDCPTPSATTLCLSASNGGSLNYNINASNLTKSRGSVC